MGRDLRSDCASTNETCSICGGIVRRFYCVLADDWDRESRDSIGSCEWAVNMETRVMKRCGECCNVSVFHLQSAGS